MKLRTTAVAVIVAMMGSAAGSALDKGAEGEGKGWIVKALHSDARLADDKKRDKARKPHKALKFSGIKPGMTVLDINSFTGWYTEVLSHVVGPEGTVIAHNGPAYFNFMKREVPGRYADNRLANVKLDFEGGEAVSVPEGSLDMAWSALGYHDYYANDATIADPTIVDGVVASIYKALKPGGVFMMIDHAAPAGSGYAAGNDLHRIDPALVQAQLEAAGFKLVETADFLANEEDPMTAKPWDRSVSGKTNRFVYKFVK